MLYGWEYLDPSEEELIKRGVREGDVYGGPYHLLLFPSDRCNLDCFFCYSRKLREVAAELEWDALHSHLRDAVAMGLKSVSFGGGGEPFLYHRLDTLLGFIEEQGLAVANITTNGTALTRPVARALIGSRLKESLVSLNETSPKEYGDMNGCSPRLFDRAVSGIQELVRAKQDAGSDCIVAVQVFLWKGNYRRLPEMVDFMLGLGADRVHVNTIDNLPAGERMDDSHREECKAVLRDVVAASGDSLALVLGREGLDAFGYEEQLKHAPARVMLPDMVQSPHRVEYCYIGWYSANVAANGNVYPCCNFHHDESRSIGYLYEQTLRQIWHGERAARFRDEMRHLLLTDAEPALLPGRACFLDALCVERGACAFSYYLARPKVYTDLHAWAQDGPGPTYKTGRQIASRGINLLRAGRRALRRRGR
jgi:radical SAM protein with 4Fe4S-binding SPASM domain